MCFWQDLSLLQHPLPYLQYLCNLIRPFIPTLCGHHVKPNLPSQSLSFRPSSHLAEYFVPSPYSPLTSKCLLLCAMELIVLTKSPISSLSSLNILFNFLHYLLIPNRDTFPPVLEGSSSWLTVTPFYTTCIQFLVILTSTSVTFPDPTFQLHDLLSSNGLVSSLICHLLPLYF